MKMFDDHSREYEKEAHQGWRVLWLTVCFVLVSNIGVIAGETKINKGVSGISVVVSNNVQLTGERILLGHVGSISGGDTAAQQKIAAIDLGPSPRPGKERRITGKLIHSALKSSGWTAAGVRAEIPEWVVVKCSSQTLSEASLGDALKAYVAQRAGGDEVVVSRIRVRGAKTLPLGKISMTAVGQGDRAVKGKVGLRFTVSVGGKDYGQVTVSGWVDRYARAVCAARFLPLGAVITGEDICLKRINVSKASNQILFDPSLVVGKRLRSGIGAGECLRERILTVPPLIQKGDQVKILAHAGAMSVSTMGTAVMDGSKGEQIRVENSASEKTVIGRVVDEDTVEVMF